MLKNKKVLIPVSIVLIIALIVTAVVVVGSKDRNRNAPGVIYSELVKNGYKGTCEQLFATFVSENASDDKTAYDLLCENGYSGKIDDWLYTVIYNNESINPSEKSSYDLVCENGFTGTEEQWLETLEKINETEGTSLYLLACENGFEGSSSDWLDCISGYIGDKNTSIYDFARKKGFKKNATEFVTQLVIREKIYTPKGKSAYELAVFNGFTGTIDEWLNNIAKEDDINNNCRTLYNLAVENGYQGNFTKWLSFLVTSQYESQSPYELLTANGYGKSLRDFLFACVSESNDSNSYYDAVVTDGYSGSNDDWISIISGKLSESPFKKALDKGYEGTEEDFYNEVVNVLNGEKPKSGIISKVYIDENNRVIVELKDSTKIDVGNIDTIETQDNAKQQDNDNQTDKKPDYEVKKYYTVTFKDYDDSVIAVHIVEEGASATAPTPPVHTGYAFKSWDKAFDKIKENTIVKAVYKKNNNPVIIVDNVIGKAGANNVQVAISIENNPGILGMTLTCEYDSSVMTLKSVENGEAVSDVLTLSKSRTLESGCRFSWDGLEIQKDDIKNGNILLLNFELNDTAKIGKYPVTVFYEDDGIVDSELNSVSVEIINGSIEIVN